MLRETVLKKHYIVFRVREKKKAHLAKFLSSIMLTKLQTYRCVFTILGIKVTFLQPAGCNEQSLNKQESRAMKEGRRKT